MVAGVITGGVDPRTVKKAVACGADVLELRVDTFRKMDAAHIASGLERVIESGALRGAKVLLTVRGAAEGGAAPLTDARRIEFYDALMPYADFADVELSSRNVLKNVVDFARRDKVRLIVSYHNFRHTPGIKKLLSIIENARRAGADIVKIATFVKRGADLTRLAGVLAGSRDLIVIGMGEAGAPTRVFFPMIGSLVTYGSIGGRGTAPGQLALPAIKKELRRYGF